MREPVGVRCVIIGGMSADDWARAQDGLMRKLYEAADRVEAQMLKDYLQEHGVATVLLGDFLSGGAGELPANIFPSLWVVKEEQYHHGRWLIEAFEENRREQSSATWRCTVCGESIDPGFEICWNCATPRMKEE